MFKKLGTYVSATSTSIIICHNVFFCSVKILLSEASTNSTVRSNECVPCGLSLIHAAGDATAVTPTPLMGGQGGSEVDIDVVAPVMSSAVVGRILGNRNALGRRSQVQIFCLQKLNRNESRTV